MRRTAVLCALLLFSACTSTGQYLEETAARPDPLSGVADADLKARQPAGGGFLARLGFSGGKARQGKAYFGTDTSLTTGERQSLDRLGGEQFEVNLENADIAVAARNVLGEILGISYTLDPRVTGTVSIVTAKPTPAGEILAMLESALRSNGVAMVREGDSLKLMPASEALGVSELDQNVTIQPGYGVTVVAMQHVSAETILPLLENFVARAGMVRVDPGQNALIFQGTAGERRAAIEAAKSFDQDWLAKESVGIFPVQNSNAAAMMTELNRVLDLGEGGRGRNTMRLQPIERSNSILVVAKSRTMLQRAATWIARLDNNDAGSSNLRVYRVQHVDAKQLAAMVNDIFRGGSVTDDPAAQFPPDSDPTIQQSGQGADPSVNQRMADQAPADASAIGLVAGGVAQPSPITPSAPSGSSAIRVTANNDNSSILIYAPPDQQRIIEQAIVALDRPSAQVAIEATIAEVSLTNDLRYGVQFFLNSDNGSGTRGNKGSIGLFQQAGQAAISRVLPGFNLLLGSETDPSLIIDALRGVTEVKVLSTPSVVVMDNKTATLQVGDEIPIVTRTAQSVTNPDAPVVNNVEFRNTGVILKVLPKITANGTINLLIEQEISSVAQGASAQSLTPTISQRRISSTVSVTSGQTVLLGGLVSERQQRGRDGVPVLGDIPIVGDLFRSNRNSATRTELIVLIRPQVIRDSLDAQQIAEQMRSQLRLMNEPTRNVPLNRPAKTLIE